MSAVHLRIDNEIENSKRKMACGIGPVLPEGDKYVFEGEGLFHMVTCKECGGGPQQFGTPISELSGQPGRKGYEEFKRIAKSWGYE